MSGDLGGVGALVPLDGAYEPSAATKHPVDVLLLLEAASSALDQAVSVEDAVGVRGWAESLRYAARQAGAGLAAQNKAAELKLRAERRAGELLAASDVGRGKKSVTLADFGVGHSQSKRWQRVASLPGDLFDRHVAATVDAGRELTTAAVLQLARAHAGSDPETKPTLHLVPDGQGLAGLDGQFATIVADPPWDYGNSKTRNAARKHYHTMSVAEICDMPVEVHAADASHLYLWTTTSFLREAFEVVEAWGFVYKTCLTWVKPQMGMGNYFRVGTEHVLFGVRGGMQTNAKNVPNWFEASRTRHSAKPDCFYDLVECSSDGPYLELFARARRLGDWTTWGNEA